MNLNEEIGLPLMWGRVLAWAKLGKYRKAFLEDGSVYEAELPCHGLQGKGWILAPRSGLRSANHRQWEGCYRSGGWETNSLPLTEWRKATL